MKSLLTILLLCLAVPSLADDEDATWTAVDQADGSRVVTFDVKGKGGSVEVRTRAGEVLRGPGLEAGERAHVTVVEKPRSAPVVVVDELR